MHFSGYKVILPFFLVSYFFLFFVQNVEARHVIDVRYSRDVCQIEGKVLDVRLGRHSKFVPDGVGGKRKVVVRFTELKMSVTKSKMLIESSAKERGCDLKKRGEVRKYGLCEDHTIKKGHRVSGQTKGWPTGPDCLVSVKVK